MQKKSGVTNVTFWSLGYADYILGILFIILAFSILLFAPKVIKKAKEYKKRQMNEYKQKNPKSTCDYSKTGMYLPAWERTKKFAPMFFCIVFLLIGLSFLVGAPIMKTFII